jgi:CubicO group peptidase (beta-lactamase class C family)
MVRVPSGWLLLLAISCSSPDPPPAVSPRAIATSDAAIAADAADADPAGRQLATWLALFNDAKRDELAAFRDRTFSAELLKTSHGADELMQLRDQTGGFDVKRVEETTPTRASVVVKERSSDQFARAIVEVEPAPPHRIVTFSLLAIATPDGFGPARLTEAEALAALRAELDKATAADQFSGAVAIAKAGKVIFREARGMADRDAKVPNTVDTRFRIGAMNKMFTATAVLQLVQAGKLALDQPIGKVLIDYPNRTLASKVTPHHLLTHTGGTGDMFGPEFDAHRLELRTLADYVKLYGKRDVEYEPGARWVYSNYGFLLLGVIIERVTHQTYYDHLAATIFKPAGMKGTSSPFEGTVTKGRVVAYTRDQPGAPWTSAAATLPVRGTSAGGGDSTVLDLIQFANALASHTLLDAKHVELLTTGKVDMPRGKYAYGFSDVTENGVRCVGHSGGEAGMSGDLVICDSGYTVAVLSNLDPPAAGRISMFIRARLPAK